MKKFTLLFLAWLLVAGGGSLSAQNECGNGRYTSEIFPGFDLTSDLTYGSNINLNGNTQSLELDVYEPQGDTASLRPLLVWAHGGSFIGGDKTQGDITSLVEPLARMGYVSASIEYRLGMEGIPFPGPDSAQASEAVLRAVGDMKAAVRWFYKSAANGNPYRIDTNRIYVAGVSAGAIAAVHYGYLDEMSEFPAYIDTTKPGLSGGLEGSSGNPGYSSRVQGVINVCGMIADTAWIKPGDEPIVSLHGTNDGTVPYNTAMITVVGIFPIFVVDGSESIHFRAQEVGVEECLYTHPGADHVPHVNSAAYLDTTLKVISQFMAGQVCGTPSQCGYIVANEEPVASEPAQFYPNPASGDAYIRVPATWTDHWTFQLTDLSGKVVRSGSVSHTRELRLGRDWSPGLYLLNLQSADERQVLRVVYQ